MNPKSQRRRFAVLFALLALSILAPVGIWLRSPARSHETAAASPAPNLAIGRAVDRRLGVVPAPLASRLPVAGSPRTGRSLSPLGLRIGELLRGLDPAVARPGEMVVVFETAADYQGFFAGMTAVGLPIPGRIPELAAVWLGPGPMASDDTIEALARALEPYAKTADLGPNLKMFLSVPSQYEEMAIPRAVASLALFGLSAEGIGADGGAGPRSFSWGHDAMIALLDTGLAAVAVTERSFPGRDPALLGVLNAGWGNEPVDLHGSGAAAVLSWVAPGARILGVRVTDADGVSDLFSVSQGIVNAANVGANLVAVSPAGPGPALILDRAIGLVVDRGGTVVASTGGDAGSWPAADPRVIAVGSIFTRRAGLVDLPVIAMQLTVDQAPLDAATSAAVVAGALADVMSVYPRTKAADAWAALQYMTDDASAARSALGEEFFATGLQLLNLNWVGMPLGAPPARGRPFSSGNIASAGGAQGGRGGGPGTTRVLVGPLPGGRRGAGNRGGGAGDGRNGRQAVPSTQSDRTVRGTTVPIGAPGRGGNR